MVAVNEDEVTLLFILNPEDAIDEMTLSAGLETSKAVYPISMDPIDS